MGEARKQIANRLTAYSSCDTLTDQLLIKPLFIIELAYDPQKK